MAPHPSTNFEIQKYYHNKPNLAGLYLRNDLPKSLPKTMKDNAYVINLNEYKSIETHWIALYASGNNLTYFGNKNIMNVFRI